MLHLTFISELHQKLNENGIDPIKWEIRSLPIVSSTNDYVERFFKLETDQVVVLSKVQEQGRGRNSNRWESPDGGMWLSIGVRKPSKITELSTPVVKTVHDVLMRYVNCEIKDPNDILVDGKKLCGVLVETKMSKDTMSEIIIGVGVNVTNELPDSISDIATRLSDHVDDLPTVPFLATEIAYSLIKMLIDMKIAN